MILTLKQITEDARERFAGAPPGGVQSCLNCHWIGISLVDQAGNAQAGERYVLMGPGESEIADELGEDGTARVEGLAGGVLRFLGYRKIRGMTSS